MNFSKQHKTSRHAVSLSFLSKTVYEYYFNQRVIFNTGNKNSCCPIIPKIPKRGYFGNNCDYS